jgi:hypothetical protein
MKIRDQALAAMQHIDLIPDLKKDGKRVTLVQPSP